MRTLSYLLALILFMVGCSEKKPKEVSAVTGDFKVNRFQDLPSPIRNAFLSETKGELFADPGQKWNPTDAIWDETLPRRRLIFAGSVDGKWFAYYEHGGLGKHQHLVALSLDAHNKASLLANMYASDGWTQLSEIKHALELRDLKSSGSGGHF